MPFEPFQFTPAKTYPPTADGLIEFIHDTPGLMDAVADAFVENYLAISHEHQSSTPFNSLRKLEEN